MTAYGEHGMDALAIDPYRPLVDRPRGGPSGEAERQPGAKTASGQELVLHVGGWRRSLVLPRALLEAPARGAKMDGQTLRIRFEAPKRATQGARR